MEESRVRRWRTGFGAYARKPTDPYLQLLKAHCSCEEKSFQAYTCNIPDARTLPHCSSPARPNWVGSPCRSVSAGAPLAPPDGHRVTRRSEVMWTCGMPTYTLSKLHESVPTIFYIPALTPTVGKAVGSIVNSSFTRMAHGLVACRNCYRK